jgi:hypothetical protein
MYSEVSRYFRLWGVKSMWMYEDQYNASKKDGYLLWGSYLGTLHSMWICLEMTFLIIIADEYDQVITSESYSLW